MPPLVSILLPTHNRADVLPFAIEAALAQTLPDFELLVMGDGCTDNTAAVVGGYRDPRLTWLDWPKSPAYGYANRNAALRRARGDFIAYLAHDDLWFPDHLQRLVGALREHQAEFAYARPLDVSVSGQITPQVFNLHDPRTRALWQTKHIGYLSITNVVHRRACLAAYGEWSERLARGADWELWSRILAGGQWRNFVYDPVPTGLHFVADWRRGLVTWRTRLWHQVRAREKASPALTIAMPAGVSEQAAVWGALSAAPVEWVRTVRQAVQVELDRRATHPLTLSNLLAAGFRHWREITRPPRQWEPLAAPAPRPKP